MSKSLILISFLFYFSSTFAQENKLVVKDILISGNHHTKKRVIQRELGIASNDTILLISLDEQLESAKLRLLGTGLFNSVTVNIKNYNTKEGLADIDIALEENWYLFPVPVFELADRNFSVWWTEQEKSLKRVNYGFRLSHYNFSGNRDALKFKVHFGYTRKYEVNYLYQYLGKENQYGLGGSIFYAENREIAYKTEGNKTLFAQAPDERKMLSRFRVGPEVKYRPDFYNFHGLRLEFHHNKIDELVATDLNPNYFLDGQTGLRFFYLEYDYNHDKRLYSHYPLGGHLYFANIKKEGLGIFNEYSNLSIIVGVEKHWSLKEKFILSTRFKAKTNLIRNTIAFANNTGLGWNSDIVSGYELYVIDGTDYGISMNSVKWLILNNNFRLSNWMPRQFKKVNLTMFLRFNFDGAIVNENNYTETNTLNNRLIYGFGPALDLILFNNFLFSFEYSFNDIGERGLYFHNSFAF